MRTKPLYAVLKILFGAFLLVTGLLLLFYKLAGRQFPEALEWLWGTISYSPFFGTVRVLLHLLFGTVLIWDGRMDFKRWRRH
jgi:hypothetical protein